jgi:hypothetical protein
LVASGSDKVFITFSDKEIAKATADTARENITAENMGILAQLEDKWLDDISDLYALEISEPEPVKADLGVRVTKPENCLSSPGKATFSKQDSLSHKRKHSKAADTSGNNLSPPLYANKKLSYAHTNTLPTHAN